MDSYTGSSQKRKLDELYSDDNRSACDTDFLTGPRSAPISSGLCSRCSQINLDEIFMRKIDESDSSFVANIGSIADLEASCCPICRVFASIAPKTPVPKLDRRVRVSQCASLTTEPYHLRVFSASRVFSGFRTREAGERFQDINVLGVAPSNSSSKRLSHSETWDIQKALNETGYLSSESSVNTKSICKIRRLDPLVFDFTLADTWISYCNTNHRTRCSRKTLSDLRRFRVFNCRTRQVVEAPEACQYTALSYVWGKKASSRRSSVLNLSPGNNGVRFEKVIEDSITVTKTLGLEYLWVDRICINQADDDDKRHQVGQMDLIYANSALTIIAAAGSDPSHGLAGVNGTPRVRQQRFEFQKETLISTLPAPRYTVEKCKWHTRGWTYQESVLSTRRLIFTETQVLFECGGMHCSEAIDIPLDSMHNKRKTQFDPPANTTSALPVKTPGSDPTEYMAYVASFSLRELTYRQDTLNAFQGVLAAFARAKQPVYHFWGIPIFLTDNNLLRSSGRMKIYRSMSARFAISLFWCSPWISSGGHAPSMRAKIGFPSWSWTGWDGHVDAWLPFGNMKSCFSDVRVWLKECSKSMVSLDEIDFQPRMSALHDVYSSIIQIEGWTIPVSITHLCFTAEEKAGFAKKNVHWAPQDGVHVSFKMGSRGTVYSRLDCHGLPSISAPDQSFMGFLSSAYAEDQGSMYEIAMLLKRVNGHYERAGLFRPRHCWSWYRPDGEGKLHYISGGFTLGGREALGSIKQRFWLG